MSLYSSFVARVQKFSQLGCFNLRKVTVACQLRYEAHRCGSSDHPPVHLQKILHIYSIQFVSDILLTFYECHFRHSILRWITIIVWLFLHPKRCENICHYFLSYRAQYVL